MSLTVVDWIAIFVYSLITVLIIISTSYDVINGNVNHKRRKLFTAFSLYSNIKDLVRIDQNASSSAIQCFNGLRVLSAIWVIGGHRIFRDTQMTSKPVEMNNPLSHLVIAILMTNVYAVDIFFLMSGVLISISCLKSLKKKNLNLWKIYVNRYFRYIPSIAVILLFYMSSLTISIGDGVNIGFLKRRIRFCHDWWWSSMLLVQNYLNLFEVCMDWTWYFSTDFQLFILSPFFIYLLWMFKFRALWILLAGILGTQMSIFFVRFYDILHPNYVLRQTHFRLGQFLIGIILGFIMHERAHKTYMKRTHLILGWTFTLSLALGVDIFHEIFKSNKFMAAFYEAVSSITWTMLMSWIIFVCHHLKSGGIVNWILSLPIWQPAARISMSVFIVHMVYINLTVSGQIERWHIDSSWLIHILAGDIVASFFYGGILYLAVEAPSGIIARYCLR